jgi:pectate lyase
MLAVSMPPAGAADQDDPARETLAAGNGWASAGPGTTGGSEASEDMVFVVTTKTELVQALAAARHEPAIITVRGTIDLNTSLDGDPLTCQDYADPAWDLDAYLEAYDPAHYEGDPSGPLEDARQRSHDAQLASVRLEVPSNVTLIGEDDARLLGASLLLRGSNTIVRNIELTGLENCFPQRNADGWVSEGFDVISLIGATNVWLDHLTIDGPYRPGEPTETIFGDKVHRVDGLLDITNQSDLVTVSWSTIRNGSTSVLIGNGDRRIEDEGRLRVTFHHNRFEHLAERAPRVRYGMVHVYNNLYVIPDAEHHVYSWGVGVRSKLWIEDNAVVAADGVSPADLLLSWGGTEVHVGATLFNGEVVDALAAYNASVASPLAHYEGPAPVLYGKRHPLPAVEAVVRAKAGAHRL